MRNERESDNNYLPPQEQLIIAAKVNRLCDATPETFDPETQVQDAKEIVNALHSRIKPQGRAAMSASRTTTSRSNIFAGVTDNGNVNASFDQTKTDRISFGIEEYRIGNYVAHKLTKNFISALVFEHFWDRDLVNEAFNRNPKVTRIIYNNETCEVCVISEGIRQDKTITIFSLSITKRSYKEHIMWTKSPEVTLI